MKIFRFYDSCCDWDAPEHIVIMADSKEEAIKIVNQQRFDFNYTDIFEYENKPQVIHIDYMWG